MPSSLGLVQTVVGGIQYMVIVSFTLFELEYWMYINRKKKTVPWEANRGKSGWKHKRSENREYKIICLLFCWYTLEAQWCPCQLPDVSNIEMIWFPVSWFPQVYFTDWIKQHIMERFISIPCNGQRGVYLRWSCVPLCSYCHLTRTKYIYFKFCSSWWVWS